MSEDLELGALGGPVNARDDAGYAGLGITEGEGGGSSERLQKYDSNGHAVRNEYEADGQGDYGHEHEYGTGTGTGTGLGHASAGVSVNTGTAGAGFEAITPREKGWMWTSVALVTLLTVVSVLICTDVIDWPGDGIGELRRRTVGIVTAVMHP